MYLYPKYKYMYSLIYIFSYIQMLGTFCIDRCPFMIKKVQIHYVIRLKSPTACE